MKESIKVTLTGLAVFAGLLLLGTATSWFGLVAQRPMVQYKEETRAKVYDTSRQFQQGTNRDIARYCREYSAAEGSAKVAVADLILTTRDTYQGELTPANSACIAEIEGN